MLTRPLLELRYQGTELREFVITVGIKATPLLKEWHIKAEVFLKRKDEFWNSVLFSPQWNLTEERTRFAGDCDITCSLSNSPFDPAVLSNAEAKVTTQARRILPSPRDAAKNHRGPFFTVLWRIMSSRSDSARVSSRRVPLSLCSICKLLGMIPEESVTTLAAEPCQSLCRPTVRCGLLLSLESYLAWSHACVEFYIKKKKKKELKLCTPQRGNIGKIHCYCYGVFFLPGLHAVHKVKNCHYLVSHEETQI